MHTIPKHMLWDKVQEVRGEIDKVKEVLGEKVLTLALERQTDREARPVTVYQNFYRLSGAWILALPGPDTGISSMAFTEAMASHLCLPSPSVVLGGCVGKKTVRGGAVIDQFGDAVMNCKYLPGDTWRHDTGKLAIVNEASHP